MADGAEATSIDRLEPTKAAVRPPVNAIRRCPLTCSRPTSWSFAVLPASRSSRLRPSGQVGSACRVLCQRIESGCVVRLDRPVLCPGPTCTSQSGASARARGPVYVAAPVTSAALRACLPRQQRGVPRAVGLQHRAGRRHRLGTCGAVRSGVRR